MKRYLLKITAAFLGVVIMLTMFGCGKQKYRLILPHGFESEKSSYAAGEEVTVTYSWLATDTDYSIFCDADDVKKGFDEGYVFSFIMPERDVTFWMESRNTMEYKPHIEYTEAELLERVDEGRMVFDYYEAVTGTDGGDGYVEYVLCRWEEDDLLLARYTKTDGEYEKASACRVPLSYLYDCLKEVNKAGMRSWKDGNPLDGMVYVIKFKDGDEVVRITSDDMPEDGIKAFGKIEKVMSGAWSVYGPKKGQDPGSIGIIDDPVYEEEK